MTAILFGVITFAVLLAIIVKDSLDRFGYNSKWDYTFLTLIALFNAAIVSFVSFALSQTVGGVIAILLFGIYYASAKRKP